MPTYTVSNGDDFVVKQLDRSYRGALTEAFKVDGNTGTATVNGITISASGALGGSGPITGTTASFSSTLAATGDATLGGDLDVTGTITSDGSEVMTGSLYSAVIAGANASVNPVSTVLAGAVIGDKVVAVVNLTGAADVQTSFETAVTVPGHIQQTATDLTAATAVLVILQHL